MKPIIHLYLIIIISIAYTSNSLSAQSTDAGYDKVSHWVDGIIEIRLRSNYTKYSNSWGTVGHITIINHSDREIEYDYTFSYNKQVVESWYHPTESSHIGVIVRNNPLTLGGTVCGNFQFYGRHETKLKPGQEKYHCGINFRYLTNKVRPEYLTWKLDYKLLKSEEEKQNEKEQEDNRKKFNEYVGYGNDAIRLNKIENAIKCFRKALEYSPNNQEIISLIGELKQELQNKNESEASREKYDSFISQGNEYLRLNKIENAIASFKKALELDPSNAIVKSKINELENALEQDRRNEANSEAINNYIDKGNDYLRSKNLEKALEYFQKALHLDPSSLSIKSKINEIENELEKRSNSKPLSDLKPVPKNDNDNKPNTGVAPVPLGGNNSTPITGVSPVSEINLDQGGTGESNYSDANIFREETPIDRYKDGGEYQHQSDNALQEIGAQLKSIGSSFGMSNEELRSFDYLGLEKADIYKEFSKDLLVQAGGFSYGQSNQMVNTLSQVIDFNKIPTIESIFDKMEERGLEKQARLNVENEKNRESMLQKTGQRLRERRRKRKIDFGGYTIFDALIDRGLPTESHEEYISRLIIAGMTYDQINDWSDYFSTLSADEDKIEAIGFLNSISSVDMKDPDIGFIDDKKTKYYGGIKDGVKHGFGLMCTSSGFHLGHFEDDVENGKASASTIKGSSTYSFTCKTNYINGSMDGYSIINAKDYSYKGQFKINQFFGEGYYKKSDGTLYEGNFLNGKYHGKGKQTSSGYTYIGEFKKGFWDGYGVYTLTFKEEEYVRNCKNCVRYEGQWKEGKKHGLGKCFNKDNKLLYDGPFAYDEPTKKYRKR